MRVYIAGPMAGIPMHNFPAFDAAAGRVVAAGHVAVNPADLDRSVGFAGGEQVDNRFLRDALARDIAALADCDGIALLPGWRRSLGTLVELAMAVRCDMRVLCAETLDDITEEVSEWVRGIPG